METDSNEKQNSFFEINHIDYNYVKNSEIFQQDPLLQILSEDPHFKSLEDKTQGTQRFLCDKDVSTRLSHTFQVIQLSKEIAEIKDVDVETAIRIAAFHDCGHVPFGHVGERIIMDIIKKMAGKNTVLVDMVGHDQKSKIKVFNPFTHERMSARIFDKITRENNLNIPQYLTILEGILKHGGGFLNSKSTEGKIVGVADKVSYLVQDLKDSQKIGWNLDFPNDLGNTPEEIYDNLLNDIKLNSKKDTILSKEALKNLDVLKKYMYENFYKSNDFDLLSRMLGNILQTTFLEWCSKISNMRKEIFVSEKIHPQHRDFYEKFFNIKEGESLEKMLDFNESFPKFISLSDDEILARSEYHTREGLLKSCKNYKKLSIVEK